MTMDRTARFVGTALPPLMSVEATRVACGGRGRGWVYEQINSGDFETIVDGGRRLVVTESVLAWLERKRNQARVSGNGTAGAR